MSAPTDADFPTLGFIPCPGDGEAMDAIAEAFSETAGRLEEVNAVLTGADDGEWRGLTAIAFRDMLSGDFQPKVQEAYQSFSDASRALSDWAGQMYRDQNEAENLEQEAAAIQADRDTAAAALGDIPTPDPDAPEPETDEERDQQERQERERADLEDSVGRADAALVDVRHRADALKQRYEEAGRDAAQQLRDAMALAPNEPGFWEKVGDAVSGFVNKIGDLIADIGDMVMATLEALAPILKVFNNIMGIIATGLALASLFFPALAPVAAIVGTVVLVTTYAQKVGETGSFLEAMKDPAVIAAAAGVVLGGSAQLLTKAAPALNAMSSARTVGFAMRPAGTYLSAGLTRAQYAYNGVTAAGVGVEAFNTAINPGGNHISNISDPGENFRVTDNVGRELWDSEPGLPKK